MSSSQHFDPSSANTAALPPKNIMMERERRKRYNQKLYDLRSVVPNVTKMNKNSIIYDAINYIEELQEQERSLLEEISDLELWTQQTRTPPVYYDMTSDEDLFHEQTKKRRTEARSSSFNRDASIEVMDVSVREMGNGTLAISITSNKKRNAIVRVCEAVAALDLRIITANVITRNGRIFHTLVVEADGNQSARLKEKIEATFIHLDASRSPILHEADPCAPRNMNGL